MEGKKINYINLDPLFQMYGPDIHRIKHNKNRDTHPCQLPVHLMDRIILLTTDENDIVLDPFSGTGTTAISAKRLGRRHIGFEIDPFYVDVSKEKIEKTETNFKIGGIWVSFYLKYVATIRDKDWDVLKDYFIIPEQMRTVDYQKIYFKE